MWLKTVLFEMIKLDKSILLVTQMVKVGRKAGGSMVGNPRRGHIMMLG